MYINVFMEITFSVIKNIFLLLADLLPHYCNQRVVEL